MASKTHCFFEKIRPRFWRYFEKIGARLEFSYNLAHFHINYILLSSICTTLSALLLTVGGLAFGRGNAKVRTGDKTFKFPQNFPRAYTPHDAKPFVSGWRFICYSFLSARYEFLANFRERFSVKFLKFSNCKFRFSVSTEIPPFLKFH